ncbi:MAG: Trm112 family protein [Actinomycetota bacterium]
MPVEKVLLDILVCPNCRGEIDYVESDEKIYCKGDCKYVYPVRDGIPIMLIDEAEKPK